MIDMTGLTARPARETPEFVPDNALRTEDKYTTDVWAPVYRGLALMVTEEPGKPTREQVVRITGITKTGQVTVETGSAYAHMAYRSTHRFKRRASERCRLFEFGSGQCGSVSRTLLPLTREKHAEMNAAEVGARTREWLVAQIACELRSTKGLCVAENDLRAMLNTIDAASASAASTPGA